MIAAVCLVLASLGLASCSGGTGTGVSAPSTSTTASVSISVAHNSKVAVTPSTNLHNGQDITVTLSGFGKGSRVWLSECAEAGLSGSIPAEGCGPQLAAEPFTIVDNSGSGSMAFVASATAGNNIPSAPGYAMESCSTNCVLVATSGRDSSGTTAMAPLSFSGH